MRAATNQGGSPPVSGLTIEPETVTFSKADPGDVVLTCTINGGMEITAIKNYTTTINASRYTVEYMDNIAVIRISKDYLATQSNGNKAFTIEAGEVKETIQITITD